MLDRRGQNALGGKLVEQAPRARHDSRVKLAAFDVGRVGLGVIGGSPDILDNALGLQGAQRFERASFAHHHVPGDAHGVVDVDHFEAFDAKPLLAGLDAAHHGIIGKVQALKGAPDFGRDDDFRGQVGALGQGAADGAFALATPIERGGVNEGASCFDSGVDCLYT